MVFLFLQSDACKNNPITSLELPVEITSASADCNLSWGAKTGIAATVLWFLCACMMCCIGFKESKGAADDDVEEVAVVEESEKEEPAANEPAAE